MENVGHFFTKTIFLNNLKRIQQESIAQNIFSVHFSFNFVELKNGWKLKGWPSKVIFSEGNKKIFQ